MLEEAQIDDVYLSTPFEYARDFLLWLSGELFSFVFFSSFPALNKLKHSFFSCQERDGNDSEQLNGFYEVLNRLKPLKIV